MMNNFFLVKVNLLIVFCNSLWFVIFFIVGEMCVIINERKF